MEGIYVHIFHCHAAALPPISPALSCSPSNEFENSTLNSRFPSIVDTEPVNDFETLTFAIY